MDASRRSTTCVPSRRCSISQIPAERIYHEIPAGNVADAVSRAADLTAAVNKSSRWMFLVAGHCSPGCSFMQASSHCAC